MKRTKIAKNILFLILASGCVYNFKKEKNAIGVYEIKYEYLTKKADNSYFNKACVDSLELISSLFANKDYEFKSSEAGNCVYYLDNFKTKTKSKSNKEYYNLYRLNFNIEKIISDIKLKGILKPEKPRALFIVGPEYYNYFSKLNLDNLIMIFKNKDDVYDDNNYDFIINSEVYNSKIDSSVSSLYLSSFTASVYNIHSKKHFEIKANSVSQVSLDDSMNNIIKEIGSKMENVKDKFELSYYKIKIYKANNYNDLKSFIKLMNDNNLDFYVESIDDDLIILKVKENKDISLEEISSVLVKSINNISIESIDNENKIITLSFVKNSLNII